MADLDNTPVVWYTNCGPQNMTVGQNVVFPNMAAQYNCIVQLHSTAFTRLFLPLWVGESGMRD